MNQATSLMNYTINDNLSFCTSSNSVACNNSTGTASWGCWDYWTTQYYPQVIHTSYPVYLQEKAKDKGKQAFEIIKILKDKKLVQLSKVGDFINLMDELIKIL